MPIKNRANSENKHQAIESLARDLADKPYGQQNNSDAIVRTTITLPESLLFKLEDMATRNKRQKGGLKSVSAIIRDCVKKSLNTHT